MTIEFKLCFLFSAVKVYQLADLNLLGMKR
jgi:hypothetical protein